MRMHIEVIVISGVSQRKTNGTHHLCVELKKITNDYLPNRNRLSDIENRLRVYQREKEEER